MVCNQISQCLQCVPRGCALGDSCKQMSGACRRFVCRDSGSSKEYRLFNDGEIIIDKFRVDGGIYHNENNLGKCDFMLVVHDTGLKFVFIELKGKDVSHAVQQLIDTINLLKNQLQNGMFFARLVYGGGKSAKYTENSASVVELKKLTKNRLKKATQSLQEKVEDLQ